MFLSFPFLRNVSKDVCRHSGKTTITYNSLGFRNKNNSHIKQTLDSYALPPFSLKSETGFIFLNWYFSIC